MGSAAAQEVPEKQVRQKATFDDTSITVEAVEIADVWSGSLTLNATSAISLDDCRDTLLAGLQLVVEVASNMK